MPSPAVAATLQSAALSGLSNVLAQLITAYQSNKPFVLNPAPIIQFVLWTLISTPPNFYWQQFLEERFPSNVADAQGQKRLSKTNTLKKFALDQSVGAVANNAAFLAGINALKGRSGPEVQNIVQRDLWSLLQSGWKVWPVVSVLSFTVVPANKRILFGSIIGLFWGIYLSLLASG